MVRATSRKTSNTINESLYLILPWIYAAFIALFLLSIPLLILLIFPETSARIFHGEVGHRVFRIPFPFGTLNPSTPLTTRTLFFSSVPYWGAGLMLSWSRFRTYSHWRSTCSNISLNLATGGLFFVIPMLATIWFLAIEGGNMPSGPWGICDGNHGAWRHVYDLRKLLGFTIFIPLCSFVLGLMSFILKTNKFVWVIMAASILSFLLLMYSHYWLID